jgi:hypothetical protein
MRALDPNTLRAALLSLRSTYQGQRKIAKNPPPKGGYSAFWKIVPKAGARLER